MPAIKRTLTIETPADSNELNSTRLRSGRQFKKPTKLNKSELDVFKHELIKFEIKLKKIYSDLTNSVCFINEECSEIRRQIQLNKEELIIKIKRSNGFDTNDDDLLKLCIEVRLQIDEIDSVCDKLIEHVDTYEQDLNKAFSLNETNRNLLDKEMKFLQKQTTHWTGHLNAKRLINDTELNKMKKELLYFSTDNLNKQVTSLILNNTHLKYVKTDENQMGRIFFKESMQLDDESVMLNENDMINNFIKLNDIDEYNGLLKYERLENGSFVISYSLGENNNSKYLVIFDPDTKQIRRKLNLDKNIMKMMTNGNKIAIIFWLGSSWSLEIMDEMLNIKCEKKMHHFYHLSGVDNSHLYCIRDQDFQLILFDWSLNKMKTSIKLQYTSPKQAFYIPFCIPLYYIQIIQLNQSRYIVRLDTWFDQAKKCLLIFDQNGSLVKQIDEINDEFKVDSQNNIIILMKDENQLVYYDSNGFLFKQVNLKCLKHIKLFKFYLDSKDKIYYSVKK